MHTARPTRSRWHFHCTASFTGASIASDPAIADQDVEDEDVSLSMSYLSLGTDIADLSLKSVVRYLCTQLSVGEYEVLQAKWCHLEGKSLRVGSTCAGTDCGVAVLRAIVAVLNEVTTSNVEVDHVFSCEKVPWKAADIIQHTRPRYFFEDCQQFLTRTFVDTNGKSVEVVDLKVDILLASFSCTSISDENPQRLVDPLSPEDCLNLSRTLSMQSD
jgi:hypothetical protein